MIGFIYILKSLKNNRFYIGSTNNLQRRLTEHKEGLSKYTKNVLPIKLEFFQKYPSIKLARQIEFRLKRLKRRDIIEKIIEERKIKLEP